MLRDSIILINSMDMLQEGDPSTVSAAPSLTRQADEHAHSSATPTPTAANPLPDPANNLIGSGQITKVANGASRGSNYSNCFIIATPLCRRQIML